MSVSLSLLSKFLQSSIYVVHKLGLSLVTFINCCSKFSKMVLLSPSLNGIQTGYHWTLKNILTNFLTKSLMNSSFIGNFYFSTLSDFVAVTTLSIYFYVAMSILVHMDVGMYLCSYVRTDKISQSTLEIFL